MGPTARGRPGFRVAAAMAVVAGYMVARFFVYRACPLRDWVWSDWYLRDLLMTLPRMVFFLIALALGLRSWSRDELGFHGRGWLIALVVGIALTLEDNMTLGRFGAWSYGIKFWAFFAATTIPVALFEETLFRGTLLNVLRDWRGPMFAIFGSAITFALFHFQAQPIPAWPDIALAGLIWAILRVRGVSIWWLMVIHWFDDWVLPLGGGYEFRHPRVAALQLTILIAIAWLCWRRVPVIPPRMGEQATSVSG